MTKERDTFKESTTEVTKERDELKEEVGRLQREVTRSGNAEKEIMDLKFNIEELQKQVEVTNSEKSDLGKYSPLTMQRKQRRS